MKSRHYSLIAIYLVFLIDSFGLSIIYPVLTPLFLRPEFALLPTAYTIFQKTALFGIAIASFPVAQFFGAPIIGEYSDCIGRRKAFAITITGATAGYAITALGILLLEFPLLLTGRLISGFFAGNLSICLASLADMSPEPNTRSRRFSRLASLGGIGFISGIIVGGLLSSSETGSGLQPSIPFWIVASFSLINLIMILLFFHPAAKKETKDINFWHGVHHILSAYREPILRRVYLVFFFFMVCWISAMQFVPFFLIRVFSASSTTILIALMTAGTIWSLTNALIAKWLVRKQNFASPLRFTLIILSILLLFSLVAVDAWQFIILFGLATFCSALSWTLVQTTVSLRAGPTAQGRSLGINQSIGALAAIAGPLISGLLAGINAHFVYVFAALSALIAFIIILYDTHQHTKTS